MLKSVLRKEYKNQWEKRTALTPGALKQLAQKGYVLDVEHSDIRIFSDDEYQKADCKIVPEASAYQFVLGIKEPPVDSIQFEQVHLAFSHTMKGQDYNMPLLQKFIDNEATLFDYELITDPEGARTIAFGRYAGIAGAIDTLGLAGQKFELLHQQSALKAVKQSWQYDDVAAAKKALSEIPVNEGTPTRVLIVGTGKVGKGAEEVCQWLGLDKLDTEIFLSGNLPTNSFYSVVSTRHIHKRLDGGKFDFADYLERGKEGYKSIFHEFLDQFDILLQTPYWEDKYPRLLPPEIMKTHADKLPMMVGDISCDIDGSLACTKIATETDHPVITYDPLTDSYQNGLKPWGVAVMSIDNLPCELSLDASRHFSSILPDYIPFIMDMDLELEWEEVNLPEILKRAVVVYKGKLTPDFEYLKVYLS